MDNIVCGRWSVSLIIQFIICIFLKTMSNYHPMEVVGRGNETQLQVGENLNMYGFPTLFFCF